MRRLRFGLSDTGRGDGAVKIGIVLPDRRQNLHCLDPMMQLYRAAMSERSFEIAVQRNTGHQRSVSVPVRAIADTPSRLIRMLVLRIEAGRNQWMSLRRAAI